LTCRWASDNSLRHPRRRPTQKPLEPTLRANEPGPLTLTAGWASRDAVPTRVDAIEPLDAAAGRAAFPTFRRALLTATRRTNFRLLRIG